jgi:alanine racemase
MDGHPEALIDLAAVRANAEALLRHVGGPQLMAVVKSDGYGHGMTQVAAAAVAGGAHWLGVSHIGEALELRAAGFTVPVLCLMGAPGAEHEAAIGRGVDLTVGSVPLMREIEAAARRAGAPARLHLKADTGMSRGGATAAEWPGLVAAALAAEAAGHARIIGLWSHLACADMPGHPSIDAQLAAFRAAIEQAERAGARPQVRHLANTPATLTLPQTWFDLIRPGGGIVGLATLPGGPPAWLRPAMTVQARLVQTKRVPAGTGVSYGHRYVTSRAATLGLIPLGYNEGIPRAAANTAQVLVRGRRWTISGTVCMNQVVVDLADEPVAPDDLAVLFGPGDAGEPTAQEWADALGTLSYDIVTRFGGRVPRSYSGVTENGRSASASAASAGSAGVGPPSAGPASAGLAGMVLPGG